MAGKRKGNPKDQMAQPRGQAFLPARHKKRHHSSGRSNLGSNLTGRETSSANASAAALRHPSSHALGHDEQSPSGTLKFLLRAEPLSNDEGVSTPAAREALRSAARGRCEMRPPEQVIRSLPHLRNILRNTLPERLIGDAVRQNCRQRPRLGFAGKGPGRRVEGGGRG